MDIITHPFENSPEHSHHKRQCKYRRIFVNYRESCYEQSIVYITMTIALKTTINKLKILPKSTGFNLLNLLEKATAFLKGALRVPLIFLKKVQQRTSFVLLESLFRGLAQYTLLIKNTSLFFTTEHNSRGFKNLLTILFFVIVIISR